MKTDKILYSLLAACLLLAGACAEDKGNYDYTPINEVIIDSIPSVRYCEAGGRLYIKPDIKSLNEATADLSYSWSVENKEISTNKILDIALPPLDYKRHLAALTVTDNVTKMQYRETFYLEVTSPFNWGYYFLTRKDDGATEIAYIQATPDVEPTMEDVKHVTGCGDYGFGNEPLQLVNAFGSFQSLGSYYWTIIVLTKEGDYKAIVTNNNTFLATALITEESFSDPVYRFKPERGVFNRPGDLFFVSEGKLVKFIKNDARAGFLYRPANHDKEYYWSNPCFSGNGLAFCWAYDELTHKYYALEPYTSSNSNPAAGIYADANAYDKVVEIENNVEIKGKHINAFSGYGSTTFYAYTFDADGIHAYDFNAAGSNPRVYSFTGETIIPLAGLNEKAMIATSSIGLAANHWYINNGNVIHYSPIISPQLNVWKELPSDLGLGTIEFIGFSARGSRMVVVLYDENSPEERKGSVVFIDVATKEITHTFPHILHHCVDYGGFNTSTSSFMGNPGDVK
ncbi:MAG: hypothetical protein K2O69_00295 [Odoribacter sp.]|nr:hypothetical protein [Odoribacter sp.]